MSLPELSDEDINFILDNTYNLHHNSWNTTTVQVDQQKRKDMMNSLTRSKSGTNSKDSPQCGGDNSSIQNVEIIGFIEADLQSDNLCVESLGNSGINHISKDIPVIGYLEMMPQSSTLNEDNGTNHVATIVTDVLPSENRHDTLHNAPGPSWSAELKSSHNLKANASTSNFNVCSSPLNFRTWKGENFCLPFPEHILAPPRNPSTVSHDYSVPSRSDSSQNRATNHSTSTPLSFTKFRIDNSEQKAIKNRVPSLDHNMVVPSQNPLSVSHDTSRRPRNDYAQTQVINHSAARSHTSPEHSVHKAVHRAIQHQVPSLEVHFSTTLLDTYKMFLHAHECGQAICSSVEGILVGNVIAHCKEAKNVLNHVDSCNEESRCPLTDCKRMKQFQNHFKICVDPRCSVCRILKMQFDLSRQMRVCVRNDCSFCWTLIQLNENSSASLAHPVIPPQKTLVDPTLDLSSPERNRRHSIDTSRNLSTNIQSPHAVSLIHPPSFNPLNRSQHGSMSTSQGHCVNNTSSSSSNFTRRNQDDTEEQLALLVHSLKCRKLDGQCNKPGCAQTKKALLHLPNCKKKVCPDKNCQREFFNSVLKKHLRNCSTGCAHMKFFKSRLGNHPFRINDAPVRRHASQNVDETTSDIQEENTSTSRLEQHAASGRPCTNDTPTGQHQPENAQLPSAMTDTDRPDANISSSSVELTSSLTRSERGPVSEPNASLNSTSSTSLQQSAGIPDQEQPVGESSNSSSNFTTERQHQPESAQLPSAMTDTDRPDANISSSSVDLTSSLTRSERGPVSEPNAFLNSTSSTSLQQSAGIPDQEQPVGESSSSSSNFTTERNMRGFDEKVSLVLHAMDCQMSEDQCLVRYCTVTKDLVRHFVSCENERNCKRCELSRKMFRSIHASHWEICRQRSNCNCCELFKNLLGDLPPYTNKRAALLSSSIISRSSSSASERTTSEDEGSRTRILPSTLPENEAREIGTSVEKRIKLEKSCDEHKKQVEPEEPEDDLCKICMDAPMNTVFLECGHIVACVTCGEKSKKCPICRQKIKRIVRTFKA